MLGKTGTYRSVEQSPGKLSEGDFYGRLFHISYYYSYAEWLKAVKGQLNYSERQWGIFSEFLVIFKAKAMWSRRHSFCNTQELTNCLQEGRVALTTACSETSVDTATETERCVSNKVMSQQISSLRYCSSSSGSKRGDLMMHWWSSAVSTTYCQDWSCYQDKLLGKKDCEERVKIPLSLESLTQWPYCSSSFQSALCCHLHD